MEERIGSSKVLKVVTQVGGRITDVIGLLTGEAVANLGGAVVNVATDAITDIALRGRRIVLDDMERRGADLTVIAVLGFIDFLQNNGSQVVVLFNDEKIGSRKSRNDLMTFREKAFNVELEVRPSTAEAYKIALGNIKPLFEQILRDQYLQFEITDIRVGQRIVQAVEYIFADRQTLPLDIVREVMPAIVVATGLFYEVLPEWPSLSVVAKEIGEREVDKKQGRRRERTRAPVDDLIDNYLIDIEPDFFRLVVQHISTGDLLEQPFHDYWIGRVIRREVDELFDDTFWSPSITRDISIKRGQVLMEQTGKLDRERLRKLSSVFNQWGFYWLAKEADAAEAQCIAAASAVEVSIAGTELDFSGNELERSEEALSGVAELEKAMWDCSDRRFFAPTVSAAIVNRGSTEMFETLFSSKDRGTFRRSVLFLKAWLEEHDEEWEGAIGTALRKVLTQEDSQARYQIFHREIEVEEYGKYTNASPRFKALIGESPEQPESIPTAD